MKKCISWKIYIDVLIQLYFITIKLHNLNYSPKKLIVSKQESINYVFNVFVGFYIYNK